MKTHFLLSGISLKSPHYTSFIEKKPEVAWVEVHSENYFGEGGQHLKTLEQVRKNYPVSLHGVSLSLGSSDELNWQYLKNLNDLIARIEPCLVSDHLSWSSLDGEYFHDLLPLPFTEEVLKHVLARVQTVQEYLKRPILIENISNYVAFACSTYSEQDFLIELAKQSGCGILLDVNNIYVSAMNLGFNPEQYILQFPKALVQEIHLAGFTSTLINEKEVLIDTHNRQIMPAVWDLYRYAVQHLGPKPTIIEWDSDLPALETLVLEAFRAEKIIRENHGATQLTA